MKSPELLPYVNDLAASTSNVLPRLQLRKQNNVQSFFVHIRVELFFFFVIIKTWQNEGEKKIAIIRRFIAFFCF